MAAPEIDPLHVEYRWKAGGPTDGPPTVGRKNMEKEENLMNRFWILKISSIFIVALSISSCGATQKEENTSLTPGEKTPMVMEDNFNFRIAYGPCLIDTYDSESGIYTMDMGPNHEKQSATFELSDDEMSQIFMEMIGINYFEYPEEILLPTSTNGSYWRLSGASHYDLYAVNGKAEKHISWTNDIIEPMSAEGENFIQLIKNIRGIIENHEEVKALPKRMVGCI